MEPIFVFPAKRDVAGMSAQLAEATPEQRIAVGIETDRYGVTLIAGPVWVNDVDEMVLGGVHIAKKQTMKNELAVRAPEREVKRVLLEAQDAPRGSAVDALSIGHGDFVSVDFTQHPYGDFTVTGVATAGDRSEFVMVDQWIIHDSAERNTRATETRLIAAADAHDMPIPSPRTANFSAADSDVV